jgi:hypothetical protein
VTVVIVATSAAPNALHSNCFLKPFIFVFLCLWTMRPKRPGWNSPDTTLSHLPLGDHTGYPEAVEQDAEPAENMISTRGGAAMKCTTALFEGAHADNGKA